MKYSNLLLGALLLPATAVFAQTSGIQTIPSVLHGVTYNAENKLSVTVDGKTFVDNGKQDAYVLSGFTHNAKGAETGLMIDLQQPAFDGSVIYGPLLETDRFPTVSWQGTADIKAGKALLEIKDLFEKGEDFYRLQDRKQAVMGYRVLNALGKVVYEGRIAYRGNGPYEVVPTIIEGPLVNELAPDGCVLSYETQLPVKTSVTVGGKTFGDQGESTHHEIRISGLQSGTTYPYQIIYGDRTDKHTFATAPVQGSRKEFTFGFTGANRAAIGGGEREFGATNFQNTRAAMALAVQHQAKFMAVVGDFSQGGNVLRMGTC